MSAAPGFTSVHGIIRTARLLPPRHDFAWKLDRMSKLENILKQSLLFRDRGQISNIDEANLLRHPEGLAVGTRPDKGEDGPRTSSLLALLKKTMGRLWAARADDQGRGMVIEKGKHFSPFSAVLMRCKDPPDCIGDHDGQVELHEQMHVASNPKAVKGSCIEHHEHAAAPLAVLYRCEQRVPCGGLVHDKSLPASFRFRSTISQRWRGGEESSAALTSPFSRAIETQRRSRRALPGSRSTFGAPIRTVLKLSTITRHHEASHVVSPKEMPMTTSPTAAFLKLAIANSDLTQREIAQQAGLPKPNVLSMMKTGETKVPLNRIPALAEACRVDAATFIRIAMTEYHPEIWRVLEAEFSSEASRDERALLDALFSVNVTSQVIWDEPLLKAIRGVIELGQARPRTRQDITEEEIDRLLG